MTNENASSTYATASITRDSALALIVAARHAARNLGIDVAIAVTDAGGHLTAFERADTTPFLTTEVAINKAWTAASFGLSTLVWNQVVSQAATAPLAHHPRVMAVSVWRTHVDIPSTRRNQASAGTQRCGKRSLI